MAGGRARVIVGGGGGSPAEVRNQGRTRVPTRCQFQKKICPRPSDVRGVRRNSVPKLSKVRACPKIVRTLIIGIMLMRDINNRLCVLSELNPRPWSVFRHLRQCRGGRCNHHHHPLRVSKLSVVELSGKIQWIALDEFSRLVVRFWNLGQYLTQL